MPAATLRRFLQQHLQPEVRRLVVGFSGGLDSTVLLHLLCAQRAEHGLPVHVLHVHHGLSLQADAWAAHAQQLAAAWQASVQVVPVTVARTGSLEEAARRARYAAFNTVLQPGDVLLLAHHARDQAETLLLRLLRGSDLHGLAAMQPVRRVPFGVQPCWRPLLFTAHTALHAYAADHQLLYVDDHSNQDTRHDRNFVRQIVLPLLVSRWSRAVPALAETSRRLRDSEALLDEVAATDLQALLRTQHSLHAPGLLALSAARARNLLRYWLQQQQVPLPEGDGLQRVLTEVCAARADAQPCLQWQGWQARRYRDELFLLRAQPPWPTDWQQFWLHPEHPVLLPDGRVLRAVWIPEARGLSSDCWQTPLRVCARQGGEQLRLPGSLHHQSVKKLLQQSDLPPWQRERLPLVWQGAQLLAVGEQWLAAQAVTEQGGWCLRIEAGMRE